MPYCSVKIIKVDFQICASFTDELPQPGNQLLGKNKQ